MSFPDKILRLIFSQKRTGPSRRLRQMMLIRGAHYSFWVCGDNHSETAPPFRQSNLGNTPPSGYQPIGPALLLLRCLFRPRPRRKNGQFTLWLVGLKHDVRHGMRCAADRSVARLHQSVEDCVAGSQLLFASLIYNNKKMQLHISVLKSWLFLLFPI